MSTVTTPDNAPSLGADLRWVRPPQQERSRRTMERLVDATERLIIARGSIDQCTIQDIVKEAGSSVGSFYARFEDKEALMRHVFERFMRESVATAKRNLDPKLFVEVSLVDALNALTLFLLATVRSKAALVAALLHRPEDAALKIRNAELLGAITDGVFRLITERGATLGHPQPERAIRVLSWFVFHAMEGFSLTGIDPYDDKELAQELANMILGHLQIEGYSNPRPTTER